MTVVNPKSISGINSITTGSGSDDILTIHNNNGTERLRVDSTGATKIVTGIVTTLTATTGIVTTLTTNTLTANSTAKVGSGVTLSPDGDVFATGVCTATSFSGDGSNLTGISAGVSLSGSTDNTVCTVTGANAIQGESNVIIDSTGRLLVGTGHGTSRDVGDVSSKIQIEGAGYNQSSFSLMSNAGASAGNTAHLTLGKSRGSSNGDNTIVADGDALGQIQFAGSDGTDCNSVAAIIIGRVDGTPGSNDMPGRLEFKTTSDGAATSTERMRITSGGKLLIGRTSNSSYDNLLQTKSITVETDADATGMQFNRTDSNAAWVAMRFRVQGNQSGYIQVNTSSTQYSTSSDYRLKENVVPLSDGIARLKTLQPYRFNFIEDPTKTVDGFFAHEVTAVPEAVSGEKDAVDEDGNPDYQVIDHSKLVPLLTAALQEAIAKIETLESKVATLEGS